MRVREARAEPGAVAGVLAVAGAASALCAWLCWRERRVRRRLSRRLRDACEVSGSSGAGAASGQVVVSGRVGPAPGEAALAGPLSGLACVAFSWRLLRVTEDAVKNKRKERRRTSDGERERSTEATVLVQGLEAVEHESRSVRRLALDGLAVDLSGESLTDMPFVELETTYDHFEQPSGGNRRTVGFRRLEQALLVGTPLWVLGYVDSEGVLRGSPARGGAAAMRPRAAADRYVDDDDDDLDGLFLSTMPVAQLRRRLGTEVFMLGLATGALALVGGLSVVGSLAVLLSEREPPRYGYADEIPVAEPVRAY
jgi:hypothetical protein